VESVTLGYAIIVVWDPRLRQGESPNSRALNDSHVEHLKSKFFQESVRWSEPTNCLHVQLDASDLTVNTLNATPDGENTLELQAKPDARIILLNGQHRIAALRKRVQRRFDRLAEFLDHIKQAKAERAEPSRVDKLVQRAQEQQEFLDKEGRWLARLVSTGASPLPCFLVLRSTLS
jgi:hypothetical protein